jgi:hypothetical protein
MRNMKTQTFATAALAAATILGAASPALALEVLPIPEPGGIALFALGAAAVVVAIRFSRRK